MGIDGYMVSFFFEMSVFLNEEKENIVLIKLINVFYERLSMFVNVLENCEKFFLSISGVEKRGVLEKVLKENVFYFLLIVWILYF